jgi:hypothetical protein
MGPKNPEEGPLPTGFLSILLYVFGFLTILGLIAFAVVWFLRA